MDHDVTPTSTPGECLDVVPVADLSDAASEAFAVMYARPPAAMAMAPGRVNLVGEHTDYLGGLCLPVALPYATWVCVAPRADDVVALSSAAAGSWRGRLTDDSPGWQRYVLGALRAVGHVGGLDLHVASTVPLGSGLSSSAALICAVQRAVTDVTNEQLVEPAVRAEVEFVGAPTGGMDQTVALLARPDHALLVDFGTGSLEHVPWRPEDSGLELLVVDTGVRHGNDDGAFARVRAEAETAMAATDPLTDPVLARRRRHVETENTRVRGVLEAAERNDWHLVGELFTQSHASLRDDHAVSCPELDVAVATALDAGALGARMTGGGFGGSCLALVPTDVAPRVRGAIAAAYGERGWQAPRFLHGNASGPATRCR